jgi:hypothetical protein
MPNYQNCTTCNAVYINKESSICHSCALVDNYKNKQNQVTSHINGKLKKKIAKFIAFYRGKKFKFYKDAIPLIEEKYNIDLDERGIRSIINSEYYKSIAFD